MRTAVLGGETNSRGLLGQLSAPGYAAFAVSGFLGVLLWLSLGGMLGAAVAFGQAGAVVAVVYPWSSRGSLAASWARELRFRWHRRTGRHCYLSSTQHTADTPLGPVVVPAPLGRVEPLDLAGTGQDDLFLLRHNNPGEPEYLSVLVETQGQASGLRSEQAHDSASIRFGVLLAELARDGSWIRGVQQLSRIVPHDPTLHRAFVAERLTNRPGLDELVASYDDLIEQTARSAEQHRNYLVVKVPLTTAFYTEAAAYGTGPRGWAALVREELARLADLAARAGLAGPLVLGEQRTCAVLRSLQDPRFPLDAHRGVRWSNCWQSYTTERDRLIVNDHWHTRTAVLPRDGISPAPLAAHWLRPLLTAVSPSVIRTLAVRMDLTPARVARARAIRHVAEDGASVLARDRKGRVDDGTSTTMLSASQRRLRDLAPGSGHHGVSWSMAISVTAEDPTELRRACMRIQNEAANSALNHLTWQDGFQDAAVVATYPLGRGMAAGPTTVGR